MSSISNLWNSAKKEAYSVYQKGQQLKPATKLLSIMNNRYVSPITDMLPYSSAIKTGLGVASAFGFQRTNKKMMKRKRKQK